MPLQLQHHGAAIRVVAVVVHDKDAQAGFCEVLIQLEINALVAASRTPYLPKVCSQEGATVRCDERWSCAFLRRLMTPWSIRRARRRRTVVRELRLSSRTCFSVSGLSCSSA